MSFDGSLESERRHLGLTIRVELADAVWVHEFSPQQLLRVFDLIAKLVAAVAAIALEKKEQ